MCLTALMSGASPEGGGILGFPGFRAGAAKRESSSAS